MYNLRLNPSKTRELIVFRRGGHGRSQPPTSPIICGAERVDSLRVLGVVITHDLSMTAHLDQVGLYCHLVLLVYTPYGSFAATASVLSCCLGWLKQPLLPR